MFRNNYVHVPLFLPFHYAIPVIPIIATIQIPIATIPIPENNMLMGIDNKFSCLNESYYNTNDEDCFSDFWSWAEKDDNVLKNIEIEMTCSVCMINKKAVVFVDCGHLATCLECSRKLNNKCPICSTMNEKVIRVYMS